MIGSESDKAVKKYVLDTSAIIARPEILARAGMKNLVIPKTVLAELRRNASDPQQALMHTVVERAVSLGAELADPSGAALQQTYEWRLPGKISSSDVGLMAVVRDYATKYGQDAVAVVTLDRVLADYLKMSNISVVTPVEFLSRRGDYKPDSSIEASARKHASRQRRDLLVSTGTGLAVAILSQIIWTNRDVLIEAVPVWGTMVAMPLIGVGLFWYRQRFRLSYGAFEFLVGLGTSIFPLFPTFSYASLSPTNAIQILGGIYVMVRGLDNVGLAIIGTRVEPTWRKLFPLSSKKE